MFVLTFLHKKVNLHGVADAPAQLEKFVHFFAQKCTIYITTYSYYKYYNLESLKDFENSPSYYIKRYVSCNNILCF